MTHNVPVSAITTTMIVKINAISVHPFSDRAVLREVLA